MLFTLEVLAVLPLLLSKGVVLHYFSSIIVSFHIKIMLTTPPPPPPTPPLSNKRGQQELIFIKYTTEVIPKDYQNNGFMQKLDWPRNVF